MTSKAENTFKYKYDQQYGQSNQNNRISNTIKAIKVIQ